MTRDVWTGLVMLGAAIAYWIAADGIRISPLDGPVGASGLPKTLAYVLGGLALLLIVRSLILDRRPALAEGEDIAPPKAPVQPEPKTGQWQRHVRAIGMLAIGVAYLLLIPWLGYAVSIALLMLAVALYNEGGLNLKTVAVAVLGAAFFYLLFVLFLDIPLPPGFWPRLLATG